jgi:hypothetical protein
VVRVRCAGIAAGGLALRALVLSRPADVLDRLFVPDDAYYTLSVARSLARGLGPSLEGRLTSGFQPLLALLLAAAPSVGVAQAIGALSDFATAMLLAEIARRAAGADDVQGTRAAILAAGLWAASPTALGNAMNGLETSLAVALGVGAALAWAVALERGSARAWAGLGALLGACLLARVDTVFLVAIVGAASLALVVRRRIQVRALGAAVFAGAAVVAPWWAYAVVRFGTVVPESGAAIRTQALAHRETGMTLLNQLGWAAGASLGPLYADATDVREGLGSGAPVLGAIAFLALVFMLARTATASPTPTSNVAVRVLAGAAIALLGFYALYLPALWFFRRYLAPVEAVVVVLAAIGVARARRRGGALARAAGGAFGLVLVASFVADARLLLVTPNGSADQGHNGAKGYASPARAILAAAPPGAVIGSMQSGALMWFADGARIRVVNLDGVVDAEARRALESRRACAFARGRGLTHLADWKLNVDLFLARCGDRWPTLHQVAEAPPQAPELRFTLYALGFASSPDP